MIFYPESTNVGGTVTENETIVALRAAQNVLAQLIEPNMSVSAITIFLQAKEAEAKCRAVLTRP